MGHSGFGQIRPALTRFRSGFRPFLHTPPCTRLQGAAQDAEAELFADPVTEDILAGAAEILEITAEWLPAPAPAAD